MDSVEYSLNTVENSFDSYNEISLTLSAYFSEDEYFEDRTIIFDCNPLGANYRRTYLQVRFDDWSRVEQIRDFLEHHFSDMEDNEERTLTVPIVEGRYSITPYDGEGHDSTDFDHIIVRGTGNRIDFSGMAAMVPNIMTYEQIESGTPQDRNNADKLLRFFEEVISVAGQAQEEPVENVPPLLKPNRVLAQLNAISEPGDDIQEDYRKAVNEFNSKEYADSVRDVGRAAEELIERFSQEIYPSGEVPENTAGRINKLDKTEDGIPAMIGKSISPLWWLRNKANHPTEYSLSSDDSHYALICFQIAVEKYIVDFLESDVTY